MWYYTIAIQPQIIFFFAVSDPIDNEGGRWGPTEIGELRETDMQMQCGMPWMMDPLSQLRTHSQTLILEVYILMYLFEFPSFIIQVQA